MIENEIYCYFNGFLKWNIDKKTSYIVGNKTFFGKICILNLRKNRKNVKLVPQIRAGAEPEGYNLLYSISFKKFFCFKLSKERGNEASRFKGESSMRFSNLEFSNINSSIALL